MGKTAEMTNDEFPAFCRAHGLKCTAQRLAVFDALRQLKDHPSVDETWLLVKKSLPTVTRDSIYRILNEFSSLDLISRLDALSAARYDTWVEPHAHFICEVCGRVIDYSMPKGVTVPSDMPSSRHHIELRVTGVCDRCRKRK